MSPQTDPSLSNSGTDAAIRMTPAEIFTAILPALMGMAAVGIIAMLMLL